MEGNGQNDVQVTTSVGSLLVAAGVQAARAGGGGGSNGTGNGGGEKPAKPKKTPKTSIRPPARPRAKAPKADAKPGPVAPVQATEPAKATAAVAEPDGKFKAKPEAPAKAPPTKPATPASGSLAAAIEEMERELTPIGDIHARIGDLADQYREEVALNESAGVKLDRYEKEIDALRADARVHGIDLQRGPNVPAKFEINREIEKREGLIRALFLYPLEEDNEEAKALLKAWDLYRKVHYRVVEGADFGAVGYCLRLAFEAGFYEVITKAEYRRRKSDSEQVNITRRALEYGKDVYVLRGRRPAMWMLHREFLKLWRSAEDQARRERAQAREIFKYLPPDDLRALIGLRTPPPVDPVEFGVYVDDLQQKGEASTISLFRWAPAGGKRPVRGVIHLRVSATLLDPSKKQIEVLAATGSARLFFPEDLDRVGYVVAPIEPRGWVGQLCSFLYRANTAGLVELIKRWERDNRTSVLPKPAKPVVKDGEAATDSGEAQANPEASEI